MTQQYFSPPESTLHNYNQGQYFKSKGWSKSSILSLLLNKPAKYPTPAVFPKYFFIQIANHCLCNQYAVQKQIECPVP